MKRTLTGGGVAPERRGHAVEPLGGEVHDRTITGVAESKVSLIRPGIYPDKWAPKTDYGRDGHARFLFVGAEFQRKGGQTLLQAPGTVSRATGTWMS